MKQLLCCRLLLRNCNMWYTLYEISRSKTGTVPPKPELWRQSTRLSPSQNFGEDSSSLPHDLHHCLQVLHHFSAVVTYWLAALSLTFHVNAVCFKSLTGGTEHQACSLVLAHCIFKTILRLKASSRRMLITIYKNNNKKMASIWSSGNFNALTVCLSNESYKRISTELNILNTSGYSSIDLFSGQNLKLKI